MLWNSNLFFGQNLLPHLSLHVDGKVLKYTEALYMNFNCRHLGRSVKYEKSIYRTDRVLLVDAHRAIMCISGATCRKVKVEEFWGSIHHYRQVSWPPKNWSFLHN